MQPIKPENVDHDDPFAREVIAACFNTGKTVIGQRNADGSETMSFGREPNPPEVKVIAMQPFPWRFIGLALLTITVLLVFVGLARSQPPETGVNWSVLPKHPGFLGCYHDGAYLGRLNPATGEWIFRNSDKTHDLRAFAEKENPGNGHKPAGQAPPKMGPLVDKKPNCKCDQCRCEEMGNPTKDCKCKGCVCDLQKGQIEQRGPALDRMLAGVLIDPRGSPAGPRFRLAGPAGVSEVTEEIAFQTLADGDKSVPDDANFPILTVIGERSAREPVMREIEAAPEMAWLKGRTRIQGEDPGTWRAGPDRGFVQPKPGGVVIYAQRADGTVIWRQDDFKGGAAELNGRLLDRVDGYRPERDPNPRNTNPRGPPVNAWWLLPVLSIAFVVLVGIAALVVVKARRKSP